MNKDFISLEGGRTILNVNTIAMIFPDGDESNDMTCVNIIGGDRTYYIKENFESVKKKLNNRIIGEE